MSKATYLDGLNYAHTVERESRHRKARAPYKNKNNDHWIEVCNAHNRRVIRKASRSVGKANKNGCRRTAMGLRGFLNELNMWAQVTGGNRESLGLPKRVYRISHEGVISHGQ
ncbi:hypothetical protein [Serratia proteamaculans]